MDKQIRPLRCPCCGADTGIGILSDTVLFHFPLSCGQCKKETVINAAEGKMEIVKTGE